MPPARGAAGWDLGLWSATHYMSSIPHLAQNDKTKLQNPDGESHSPVKAGHPAPEREESQESACFLCAALEGSLSELLGAGLPGSFLTRWPRPAQDAPHPGEILGAKLALRSRGFSGGVVGHTALRAGPRLSLTKQRRGDRAPNPRNSGLLSAAAAPSWVLSVGQGGVLALEWGRGRGPPPSPLTVRGQKCEVKGQGRR